MPTKDQEAYSAADCILTGITRLEMNCAAEALAFIQKWWDGTEDDPGWEDQELNEKCLKFWDGLYEYVKALAEDQATER